MRRMPHSRLLLSISTALALLGGCVSQSPRGTITTGDSVAPRHAARAHTCGLTLPPADRSLPVLPADYSAPGSPNAVMACWSRERPPAQELIDALEANLFQLSLQYQLDARWTTTASGGTGPQGNPITILWSFVPDGLSIPDGVGGGEAQPSVLFQRMDEIFGGDRALWMQRISDAFTRWSQVSGITFVRTRDTFGNDWDDGAVWGTPGFLQRRGDVRICMRAVDGPSGILAYNSFPNQGDMTLDRDENWAEDAPLCRFLRNTVGHEFGHGMGLRHVCPAEGTKLMEPFLDIGYDGPQQDDVRAAQRHYGDTHEGDDLFSTAWPLGSIGPSTVRNIGSPPASIPGTPPVGLIAPDDVSVLSIDADGEQDWTSFDLTRALQVTAEVGPIGSPYAAGAQTQACDEGPMVFPNNRANLRLQIWDGSGILPVITVDANPVGQGELLSNILLPAGRSFVRVTETNTPGETQLYSLRIQTSPGFTFTASDGIFVDRVALSWGAVTNRTTYTIFRGTTQNRADAVQIGTTNATTFNDTTAARGPNYFYWVQTSQTATPDYLVDFGGPELGFRFRPPCPPDFNQDGTLDADDLADYINCFFGTPRCPQAEFNNDGDTNADDLGDYINAFFAGC